MTVESKSEVKGEAKDVMVVNQHGYSLVIRAGVEVDLNKLVDARVFESEEEFQREFCETNGIPYVEGEIQYITEVGEYNGKIYVTDMNSCFDENNPEASVEDAVNDYEL
jgi:hypothetical protein